MFKETEERKNELLLAISDWNNEISKAISEGGYGLSLTFWNSQYIGVVDNSQYAEICK